MIQRGRTARDELPFSNELVAIHDGVEIVSSEDVEFFCIKVTDAYGPSLMEQVLGYWRQVNAALAVPKHLL